MHNSTPHTFAEGLTCSRTTPRCSTDAATGPSSKAASRNSKAANRGPVMVCEGALESGPIGFSEKCTTRSCAGGVVKLLGPGTTRWNQQAHGVMNTARGSGDRSGCLSCCGRSPQEEVRWFGPPHVTVHARISDRLDAEPLPASSIEPGPLQDILRQGNPRENPGAPPGGREALSGEFTRIKRELSTLAQLLPPS